MRMMKLSDDEFDEYVSAALASIDPEFGRYFEECPVIVEDRPDAQTCRTLRIPNRRGLLGLFHGVPLNRRSVLGMSGPNQIVLYRGNLLAFSKTPEELAEQIRKTLVHELGHYLGFSERQLRGHHY